jgi:type VI secretion system lysozyme-like protein
VPLNRTILERLRDPPEHRGRPSQSEITRSILANLQNVLNTCQGNCLTDEKYGLPHLTAVRSAMPGSIAPYEAAIRNTIEKNEPRLTAVRVRHSPTSERGFDLRFEVSGLIQDEDGRRTIRFETFADDEGRLKVR